MSEKLSLEQLREEVNPVFNTAQSCLQIVAALGDEDSENMRKALGLSEFGKDTGERARQIPPEVLEAIMALIPVFNALPESRFFSSNELIRELGAKQVVDLPCGYTARGVKLAKSGVRYFGMDLPAVIDAMEPAAGKLIGENGSIRYTGVDATNYASLRKALEGADGELLITTEGMLMYLTQAELETVFSNVRKLLLEFGGKWITMDNQLGSVESRLIDVMVQRDDKSGMKSFGSISAGLTAKTTLSNNIFYDEDPEKVKAFVSDMGFDLELIPIRKYLPEKLMSFRDLPDPVKEEAMDVVREVNFWVMTARPESGESFTCGEDNFNADVKLTDGAMDVKLTGRLDTITAPALLELFKEAQDKGSISRITIDMKELEYVSSAGLRVFLIMKKAIGTDAPFELLNMNETVQEIIETTGFDTIFS